MKSTDAIMLISLAALCIQSATGQPQPKVICYMTGWGRYKPPPMAYLPEDVPTDACDTLIFVYYIINATTFELMTRDYHGDVARGGIRRIAALKTTSPHLHLVIGVGGYDESQGIKPVELYSNMMSTQANRKAFIDSAVTFLISNGFDGLELHWYYPGAKDKQNYVKLIKELNESFAPRNLSLYAIVPFYEGDIQAGFNVPEISKYLTLLHIRTTDMQVYIDDKNVVDNASPLRRRSFDTPGSVAADQNIESVLNLYTNFKGTPKEKLAFGIPVFAHTFILQNKNVFSLGSPAAGFDAARGEFSQERGELHYHEICSRVQSGKWRLHRDEESGVPFAVNPNTGQWVSYDDHKTIIQKAEFLKSGGYGGIYVWPIDGDDFRGLCGEKHALVRTLARVLKARDGSKNNTL